MSLDGIMGESEKVLQHPSDPIKRLSKESSVPDQDSNTRLIPLTRGKFAIVDTQDFHWLNQWNWHAMYNPKGDLWYAARSSRTEATHHIWMHRVILDAPPEMLVDHRDHNGLNNQRSNIRLCTTLQNQYNVGLRKNNTSGYKGVHWCARDKSWIATIKSNGKEIYVGYFKDKTIAALAYDEAAKKLHGEFAWLNFPSKEPL